MYFLNVMILQIVFISQTFCYCDDFEDFVDGRQLNYQLLAPEIIVCRRGFLVTIPHETGLSNFEFHGNINSPINYLTPGYISKNISKPENGKWMYRNTLERLQIGDTIHYWVQVTKDIYRYIKVGNYTVRKYNEKCNSIGLFDDENSFPTNNHHSWLDVVKTTVPPLRTTTRPPPRTTTRPPIITTERSQEDHTIQITSTTTEKQYVKTTSYNPINEHLEECSIQLLNLSTTCNNVLKERDNLKTINSIMQEDIEKTLSKNSDIKTLILGGAYPESGDPQSWVHIVLFEKLKLDSVASKVEQDAFRNDEEETVFKVKTYNDKLDILKAAEKYLQNSKIWIRNP